MRKIFKRSTFALALSIAAMPILVNGQGQSLSSLNSAKDSNKSDLKDSVKDAKEDVTRLIAAVLSAGTDDNTRANLSPVIGLPKAMPTKDVQVPISQTAGAVETRRCFVVYEPIDDRTSDSTKIRPLCAYLVKVKRAAAGKETRFFRFDLNGKLEKIVYLQGKFDATGKVVRGSSLVNEPSIDSPEAKKIFEDEMKFWLKDWLKKQQSNSPKKTADSAKPKATSTAL